MVATPSEHYAKADELLGSLYAMDAKMREDFGDEPAMVPEEVAIFLRDWRKYTVELAAVHAALAGVPPIVAQLAEQEQRKAAEAKLRETFAPRVPRDTHQA